MMLEAAHLNFLHISHTLQSLDARLHQGSALCIEAELVNECLHPGATPDVISCYTNTSNQAAAALHQAKMRYDLVLDGRVISKISGFE